MTRRKADQNGKTQSVEGANQAGGRVPENRGGGGISIGLEEMLSLPHVQMVIEMKAIRRLAGYYKHTLNPIRLGERQMDSLQIVAGWCAIHRKEGGPLKVILDWSGYTSNWLKRVKHGIHMCLELGLLEYVKVRGGQRLCISHKGYRVLETFEKMKEVVRQEFTEQFWAAREYQHPARLAEAA